MLSQQLVFPSPRFAGDDGLLAVGGDLSTERLLLAYRNGIFPWYDEESPILWWSPNPRMAFRPGEVHCSHSLRKWIRQRRYNVTMDRAFSDVIRACAAIPRKGPGAGTWILPEMIEAYTRLHDLGYAHSVEVWSGDQLAGGMYGVSLGRCFFGESMFSACPNASKVAMVAADRQWRRWGFKMFDAQLHTPHLERMGGSAMPRGEYLDLLKQWGCEPDRTGAWQFEPSCLEEI